MRTYKPGDKVRFNAEKGTKLYMAEGVVGTPRDYTDVHGPDSISFRWTDANVYSVVTVSNEWVLVVLNKNLIPEEIYTSPLYIAMSELEAPMREEQDDT